MQNRLQLAEIEVDVVRKDIQNIHLSVYPPQGAVRISAPRHVELESIRLFAIRKLGWIRRQQEKIRGQERETSREYLDRESHYLWGKRYLMRIEDVDAVPAVRRTQRELILSCRPGSTLEKKQEILEAWYREQLHARLPELIKVWQPRLGVTVDRIFIQRMKTKWGSCSPGSGSIRINTELAKKPPVCLEYIVVHEMIHLLEPTHNHKFRQLMQLHYPNWQQARNLLNRLPVRHEDWKY